MQNSTNQSTKELEKNCEGSGFIAQTVLYTCVCLWRHTKLNYSVTYKKKKEQTVGKGEQNEGAREQKNHPETDEKNRGEENECRGKEWMRRE